MIQTRKGLSTITFQPRDFTAHLCHLWLWLPLFYCWQTANGFSSFTLRYLHSCYVDLRHISSGQSQLKTNGNKSKQKKEEGEERKAGRRRRQKKSSKLSRSRSFLIFKILVTCKGLIWLPSKVALAFHLLPKGSRHSQIVTLDEMFLIFNYNTFQIKQNSH